MFRIKRTRWISFGLVLAVLLLPLPASAGSVREASADGWEGAWIELLDWLGLVVVETSCAMIDPLGCPSSSAAPGSEGSESSAAIDPLGQPPGTESCAAIDPNGCSGH